jgi:nondiscriminating aspartyl-tRNA synthetase
MVERKWTADLGGHVGERVRLAGWVHHVRRLSKLSFLILRDASGLAQIVVEDAAVVEAVASLYAESVISVEGLVVASDQAPAGVELRVPSIEVISRAIAPPVTDLFRPTLNAQLPTLLDHAALTLRHPRRRAAWQLAAASLAGFRGALESQNFVEIHTPKIVGSATEGGANVFTVDYFGRQAYLAQSPQLYKQIMVGVFERVFEIGPVFRAEPHDTTRHLNEYVSLDAEMGFIEDHTTVMDILSDTLRSMIDAVRDGANPAVRLLGVVLPSGPDKIPVIHFADALQMIFEETGEDARGEPDLAPAHERWLGAWAQRAHGSEFLFVVGYPLSKRPFYTHPDPELPTSSNSFDLLFRGLEIVTGGQRLHLYQEYLDALAQRGQPAEPLEGYLEAFRHGMPPHGGFAIGLERWISQLVGAANVREVALFPRDASRLTP